MGQDVRPNVGLDYKVLHIILDNIKRDILSDKYVRPRKCFLLLLGFYLLICFVGSLQGNEGFMMELQELLQHLDKGRKEEEILPHVVIALLGEFKGEM
eukprot:6837295-Ditylum_brightwellii.AAC.1